MKILITGGAGFIGYHLTKRLIEEDNEVVIVDNFSRGVGDVFLKELEETGKVKTISMDLLDMKSLDSLEDDYDYIYHLAAIIGVQNVLNHSYDVLDKNVRLLINMIQFAKKQKDLKRFIFASTSEIYAGTLQFYDMEIPTPETTPLTITPLDHPRTSYMLSKIYGEALLYQSDIPFTIIRPHNFYGPRMGMSHVIPELLRKAYFEENGEFLEVFSMDHKRTFCYISDAVEIIIRLSKEEGAIGQSFNIGNESPEVSIGTVAETVLKVVNKDLTIKPMPVSPGSPARRCPSMKKTKECIGYEGVVSLEEGIQKTFDWYKEYIFDGDVISSK